MSPYYASFYKKYLNYFDGEVLFSVGTSMPTGVRIIKISAYVILGCLPFLFLIMGQMVFFLIALVLCGCFIHMLWYYFFCKYFLISFYENSFYDRRYGVFIRWDEVAYYIEFKDYLSLCIPRLKDFSPFANKTLKNEYTIPWGNKKEEIQALLKKLNIKHNSGDNSVAA